MHELKEPRGQVSVFDYAGDDARAAVLALGDPLAVFILMLRVGLVVPEPGGFQVKERLRRIVDVAAGSASGRIVSTLEGGYELRSLGRCVEAHVRVLMGLAGAGY